MKKLTLFSLTALFSVALIAAPRVQAEDSGTPTSVSAESASSLSAKHAIQANDETAAKDAFSTVEDNRGKVLDHCAVVQTKVKDRLTTDSQKGTMHQEQYTKAQGAVTNLIARANAAGYDTTTLTAELAVLKAKIATFEADKTTYITALQTSETDVCGKSEGDFKDTILAARADLVAVFADAKDIQAYVTATVEPTVKALKKTVAGTPTATPTASTTPTAQ